MTTENLLTAWAFAMVASFQLGVGMVWYGNCRNDGAKFWEALGPAVLIAIVAPLLLGWHFADLMFNEKPKPEEQR